MFTLPIPNLIKELERKGSTIRADVFKRDNATYPYGVSLWDVETGNTLEVRLCKSLADAISSAEGALKCSSITLVVTPSSKSASR
jgi:hypothetical protein